MDDSDAARERARDLASERVWRESIARSQERRQPGQRQKTSLPTRGRARRPFNRRLGIVAIISCLAFAAGYLGGTTTGEDLERAKASGERAGRETGAARGEKRGYARGLAEGRKAGYRKASGNPTATPPPEETSNQ